MQNEEVKKIQTLLNQLGFSLKIDGIFGKETEKKVLEYQKKYHLDEDGMVGPVTLESLLLKNGFSKEEAYINSRDYDSKTHYFIWTKLKEHHVYIFKGKNHNWKEIKCFLATVGKKDTPTIKGIFTVKYKGEEYVSPYDYKVKWYTQFYHNYLFHSILYNMDGTVFDGRLGMDLSDGCIRLKEENAKFIYDQIPSGTLVLIT